MTSPGRNLDAEGALLNATVTGILAATDLRSGEVVAGRYRIRKLVGMGGMGVVYQAHDLELDIDIALKLLRPELASRPDAFERFRQELLLARQVSSPHVVRIHDLVRHGQAWLISMDFVDGQSLEHVLDRSGALPPERAIGMLRQLAQGLAAAHHRGVVHRDLKPANILVNHAGDAAITDFGVARSAGNTGITGSGVIIGTPEYLSPEQARAEPIDGRSDLYALGLIFHEMLTATLPFRGGTPAEMLAQRIVRDPPPPDSVRPDLPSFAVRLCTRLLELKPARRFQTADDVIRAIDTRRIPGLDPRRRRRLGMLAGVAGLLVLSAAGWYGRTLAPAPPTTADVTASVAIDLAPLPFTNRSTDPTDGDLASGIGRRFADALTAAPTLRSADPLRVTRALSELGYDSATAQRHRPRVAEVIGARNLLEGELSRTDAGWVVTLSIYAADAQQPRWRAATAPSSADALPVALQRLQQQAQAELGVANTVDAWPSVASLRSIGAYQHQAPAAPALDASLQSARDGHDAESWWVLLESLDRSARNVDAVVAARQADDALRATPGRASERTRAYASLLLGNAADAEKTLAPLAAVAPMDHPARRLLARAWGDSGKFDRAIGELEKIVREDPRDIDAWFALGKYAILGGDSKRAVDDYLVRAQVLANRFDDDRMRADTANALGLGYQNLGQLPAAIDQFERAAKLRKAIGDDRGYAGILRNLAGVRSVQGDFDGARKDLDEARKLLEPLGDAAALADLVNDVGVLDEERGDYRSALESYRSALNTRQGSGNQRLIGESLLNVGFAYYQIGEFDNAQTYWQQAAATYSKIDDKLGTLRAKQDLGRVEVARGDFRGARAALDESLRSTEDLQMAEEHSVALATLAELDRLEGSMVDADRRASDALAQFEKRDDPRGITEMKLERSAIFSDVGDWANAAAALDGLKVDDVENGEQAGLLGWRLGEIALGRGDAKAALTHATDAVARAQKAHSYGSELSARLLRARALAALGKAADATRELSQVREGLSRYASVPLRLQLAETALRIAPEKSLPAYREARVQLARLPSYGRAFLIHAYGSAALRAAGSGEAADALQAADSAYTQLRANTPAAQATALDALARSVGIDGGHSP